MKYLCRAGEGVVWTLAILMESTITEIYRRDRCLEVPQK